MKTLKFKLSQEMSNYLERLDDEIVTHLRVIHSLIYSNLDNPDILDSDTFIMHHRLYRNTVIAFDYAKRNLALMLVPQFIRDSHYTWHLDFESRCFTVYLYDDKFSNITEEEYLNGVS